MNTTKGIIEGIEVKEGTSKSGNPYKMTSFKVAGKTYSGFGEYDFKTGDTIQFVVQENGKYLNFKDPVLLEEGDPAPEVLSTPDKVETIGAPSTSAEGRLKLKIFSSNDQEELENNYNVFAQTNEVKFSQFQVACASNGNCFQLNFSMAVWFK